MPIYLEFFGFSTFCNYNLFYRVLLKDAIMNNHLIIAKCILLSKDVGQKKNTLGFWLP